MAEEWTQVWEDMRRSLLGMAPTPRPQGAEPTDVGEQAVPTLPTASSLAPALPTAEGLEEVATVPLADDFVSSEDNPSDRNADGSATSMVVEQAVAGLDSPAAPPLPSAPRRHWWQRESTLIIAMIVAGSAWFVQSSGLWARWTAPQAPAPDVVATFAGGQITLADVKAHLQLLDPGHTGETEYAPEEVMAVVENLVTEEMVRRWAAQRQPESEEDFQHAMEHITEDLNLQSLETQLHTGKILVGESEIQRYYNTNRAQFGDQTLNDVREQIRQQLVAEREQNYLENYIDQLKESASVTRYFALLKAPEPTEDELRRYYEENRQQYTLPRRVVVDELQFPAGEDETAARQAANDALLKLRSGVDFAAIPQDVPRAVVTTGIPVAEGARDRAWDAVVFALTEGELSDVFQVNDAFYLVRLQKRENTRVQTFEEVRPLVQAVVAPQVSEQWFAANASKTLFTIKSSRYTVGEFYREYQEFTPAIQAQFAGVTGMQDLAERLIERLLLVADANDQLLDVQNQPLADEARLQLMQQMLHQEEIDDQILVTDQDIAQFYEQNRDFLITSPQARIRYIRMGLGNSEDEATRARQRADEAYQKLKPGLFRRGEDFAVVAREYSEDPDTAANGGELPGWIGGNEDDILTQLQQHEFNDIALSLPAGEISEPFASGDSLYIVQVLERTDPQPMAPETARPLIEQVLRQQKHDEREAELQNRLLQEAGFEIYWPVLEDYIRQLQTNLSVTPAP